MKLFSDELEDRDRLSTTTSYPSNFNHVANELSGPISREEIKRVVFDMGLLKLHENVVFQLGSTKIVGTLWEIIFALLFRKLREILLLLRILIICYWY